jgi:hypothetical protein
MVWVNPVSGVTNSLAGKREKDRIALLGKEDGSPIRWSFNETASPGVARNAKPMGSGGSVPNSDCKESLESSSYFGRLTGNF